MTKILRRSETLRYILIIAANYLEVSLFGMRVITVVLPGIAENCLFNAR